MQSSREYQGEIRRPSYVHFLCEQCKEIEENNRMGMTRGLQDNQRDQGNFSFNDGHDKRQKQ